jgi:SAM-dependent methyltransferase
LADLLQAGSQIYSVDRDRGALARQQQLMEERFPDAKVDYISADFRRPLGLPPLDGVLMANSLHFQKDKDQLLRLVRGYLKPHGRFLLVEYNSDRGNPWVPHPLSFETWIKVAARNGFTATRLLATVPSRFFGKIYSAVSCRQPSSGGV